MEQLINIKKADFVLNEFYDIVKDNYINKKVIIQKKTFHYNYDKYVKNDTIPNANDTNFKSGIIIVHICFSNKCIELKFQVGGLQGNQSYIALRTRVISRYNNYYFTLHNYIKNNFQPFGDYSKDWTSFGKKFDGFPDIKSATNETFDNLKNLIETEEMQRILNTDYEPTIPLDYEIEDINRLLDEFYRVVRQAFNDKNVKIKNKCFSDHQCNHEYTTPDMHNENYDFDYGACNVIIAFKDKTINIRMSIHSEQNTYTNHNMYTHIIVSSNHSDYKFNLHDYMVHYHGAFKENKDDWCNFEDDLTKYSNMEEATSEYIIQLKHLTQTPEMQYLLDTAYYPEIPIDWSQCGYK